MDGILDNWTLAGALGVAGFALSLYNWWSLRAKVFITMHTDVKVRTGDKWVPLPAVLELHNSGSSGFTVSWITIWPSNTPDATLRHPSTQLVDVLEGPEAPVRVEGHDSKAWTVDREKLRTYLHSESQEYIAVAGWFGSRRWWQRNTSPTMQRVRTASCRITP